MKRAVHEAIGGLDERFGLGFFDDDDLALQARQAGFELAVAHDLFVHHYGSRTVQGSGVDAEKLLEDNGGRFAEKWGAAAGHGQRVMLRPWKEGEGTCPQMTQMDADRKGKHPVFRGRDVRVDAGGEGDPDIERSQRAIGSPCFHLRPSAVICGPKTCSINLPDDDSKK